MLNHQTSQSLFERAKRVIPGGVNSPVRAFKSVGGTPVFMRRGDGAYLYDVDGNRYIDYIGSWGPFILGHNHPKVVEAIEQTLRHVGTSFGAPTELEVEFAELITSLIPSMEMVRLVSSGTEATMSAIRVARGFTGREKIIKFEGCYHGHGDSFLIKAGSGALTLGVPDSPGVTKGTAQDTLNAVFNDIESVRKLVRENPNQIAAIIIEPIGGNMGVVPATQEFLQGLRALCDQEGIVLIFDEVMTGFRVALGGAQSLYGVSPDMTTIGKILGGGLPVGAYGGRRDIMSRVAPAGDIYQAGTLSGNPLAVSAGLATLKILRDENPYPDLEAKGKILEDGFRDNLRKLGLNLCLKRVGSMMCLFMTEQDVVDFKTATTSDVKKYAAYFHAMLERGIYLAPAQYEAMFFSIRHGERELEATINANRESLEAVFAKSAVL
ncbi:MAG: glutamate-1-semialdehyde 2,1-aminomutase [Chloroherpetonaceae bacterium]|nr:glutamate-1-semialdehyde 2,1-aminomutase [Chloroherpetonaceae bacterium]MDW8436539.1 glutamate-1-semialdehyde 2,1-aminomutase [Chloroherpetonaceae bacterium]